MLGLIALALNVGGAVYSGITGTRAAGANRRVANRTADDIVARGEEDVERYRLDLEQIFGQQRTGAAAQGLDIAQGTNAIIADQTRRIGDEDMRRIRENARREAWGIRTQARINARAAENRAVAGYLSAAGTLLMVGGDAWTEYRGGASARTVNRNPLAYYNALTRR